MKEERVQNMAEFYSIQALQAIEEGDLIEFQLLFEEALINDPDEVKEQLAYQLLEIGFIQQAEQLFERLLEAHPTQHYYRLPLIDIAIDNDDIDQAEYHLDQIPQDDESYPGSLLAAADLYMTLGYPEVAEIKLKEAHELLPTNATIQFALAEYYFDQANYEAAIPYYTYLAKLRLPEFKDLFVLDRLGMCYSYEREFEEAVVVLEEALEDERRDETLYQLALVYIQLGQLEKGISLLEEIRLLGELSAGGYLALASAYLDEEEREKGEEVILEGVKHFPYNSSLYHLASDFYFQYHDEVQAEEYLRQVISFEEDSELSKVKLSFLLLRQERYDDVIEMLAELGEAMTAQGHWSLAQAYVGTEDYPKAFKHYQLALPGLAEDPEFLKEYALFLREEGENKLAYHVLLRYLQLVPEDLEMNDLFEQLRE